MLRTQPLRAADKHLSLIKQTNGRTNLSYCQVEHVYVCDNLSNEQQPSHSMQHQKAAMFVSIIDVEQNLSVIGQLLRKPRCDWWRGRALPETPVEEVVCY